jgi:TonB family protein
MLAALGSLAFHTLLMVVMGGHTVSHRVATEVAVAGSGQGGEAPMDPKCLVEEGLAYAARFTTCLAPWTQDRPACFAALSASWGESLTACRNMAHEVEITMIEAAPLIPGAQPVTAEVDPIKIEEAKKEEAKLEGQVVEIAPPKVEVHPDQSKYLAEYDSKVEHETKKSGVPEERAGEVAPAATSPAPKDAQVASPRPIAQTESGTGAAGNTAPKVPSVAAGRPGETAGAAAKPEGGAEAGLNPEEGGLLQKLGGGGGKPGAEPRPAPGDSGAGGDGRALSMRDLRPSGAALERAASGTFDALPDVDEGDDTGLNTKRFTYAGFYNRVKRSVADNWRPADLYRMRDPSGKIYGYKDRMTLLKVSLSADGRLANVIVEKACGVDFLDEEAVRAFKAAGPFPHPPQGLVDKDSKLITFSFGFQFQINDGGNWKLFRYR